MFSIDGDFSIISYKLLLSNSAMMVGMVLELEKKISISSIGGPNVAALDPFSTYSIHLRTLTRDCKAEADMEICIKNHQDRLGDI